MTGDTQTDQSQEIPEKMFYFSDPTGWVILAAPVIFVGALVAIGCIAHAGWDASLGDSILAAVFAIPVVGGAVVLGTSFALIHMTNRAVERAEREKLDAATAGGTHITGSAGRPDPAAPRR